MSPKISDDEKEKRRLQIIESASEIFSRKGYDAVTMADIVQQTGMSRGWVYLYFSSKEEIFRALLFEMDKKTKSFFSSMLTKDEPVWPIILNLLDMQVQQVEKDSDTFAVVIYEYFLGGWRETDRKEYLKNRYDAQVEVFLAFLQKGIDSGEFQPVAEIEVIGKMVLSYIDGMQMHGYAAGTKQIRATDQIYLFKKILKEILHVRESEGES